MKTLLSIICPKDRYKLITYFLVNSTSLFECSNNIGLISLGDVDRLEGYQSIEAIQLILKGKNKMNMNIIDNKIKNVFMLTKCNVELFSKTNIDGSPLFITLYHNNLWLSIYQCLDYLDLTYVNNKNNIKKNLIINNWNDGDTLLHTACWCHINDVIQKIIINNPSLLYIYNSNNMTPLQYYLIAILNVKIEIDMKTISIINNNNLIPILKYKTKNEYKYKCISFPANISVTQIIEILMKHVSNDNKNILIDISKMLAYNFLKHK